MDVRVISIGALASHPLRKEPAGDRTGHATITLVRTKGRAILVDPGLPAPAVAALLPERAGIEADQITHVFLTRFSPDTARGIRLFDHATWWIHNDEREQIINQQIASGANIIICNPELVKTGLDLIYFPTLIFLEITFNLSTMMQAAARAYRLNQTHEQCKTIYLFAEGTMEHTAVQLMSRKQRAAKLLTGDVGLTGLDALTERESGFEEALLEAIAKDEALLDPSEMFKASAGQNEVDSEDMAYWNVEVDEDVVEEPALAAADVGNLDHCSGMARGFEIDEAALRAADLALVADGKTLREGAVVERLIIVRPPGHVLQTLAVVAQEIEIHGGRIVALLDQFDLQVVGIGERDRELDRRIDAAIAEPVHLDPLDVEERADPQRLRPEAQRGFDVAHDIAVLADLAEKPAHRILLPPSPAQAAISHVARALAISPERTACYPWSFNTGLAYSLHIN